ncbi:MAG TPA: lipoate--protein ligase family protein [Gemmatimonadales bacterium]|nr:lipoate--protein ligase family protein [Gemmatimonadales bacterium]
MHIPTGMNWHLIVEPDGRSGSQNMAVDEALLLEADRAGTAFLRLYRFTPACLSFGRNEPALERFDRAAIERLGLDVVRRPTGGRAVWHDHELTYAVAAPVAAFGSLRDSYRSIHVRLASALQQLGIPATLAPDRNGRVALGPGACFSAPVGGEVVVAGKKVIGSAQVRRGTAFLQHGSILLNGSQDAINAISYQPSANGSGSLAEILGRRVTFDAVTKAIIAAWGLGLAPTVPYRPLPSPTVFSDPSWTWRR